MRWDRVTARFHQSPRDPENILDSCDAAPKCREMLMKRSSLSRMLIAGTLAWTTLSAAGCGGGEKGRIAAGINEAIKGEKTAFALQEKKMPEWPVRIRRSRGLSGESTLDPVLAAMEAAGYLKITQTGGESFGFGGFGSPIDVVAPTDEAKKWWDVQDGFVVGRREVVDVEEWTEPGAEPAGAIQAKYTWHLTDVPSWAKRSEFKNIPGMSTPVEETMLLVKTNKGWKGMVSF
jgi:hypothetical protein